MTTTRWVFSRAVCPACAKEMAVRPPQGGDGSVDVFPRHVDRTRAWCPMSRTKVAPDRYVEMND